MSPQVPCAISQRTSRACLDSLASITCHSFKQFWPRSTVTVSLSSEGSMPQSPGAVPCHFGLGLRSPGSGKESLAPSRSKGVKAEWSSAAVHRGGGRLNSPQSIVPGTRNSQESRSKGKPVTMPNKNGIRLPHKPVHKPAGDLRTSTASAHPCQRADLHQCALLHDATLVTSTYNVRTHCDCARWIRHDTHSMFIACYLERTCTT